jgi:hypothetical protein
VQRSREQGALRRGHFRSSNNRLNFLFFPQLKQRPKGSVSTLLEVIRRKNNSHSAASVAFMKLVLGAVATESVVQ